ncbi:hypothetical protein G6F37_012055 [Rhizopus arrhizus]|nr:hypothetical protein G6F38_012085 [Rhizopus arrhizus]KAG1145961.1 hypothetical protein G6F37_012055 [Rhizopus arrhizus]
MFTPAGRSFAHTLRSLNYDILALQETHASTSQLQSRFSQCLQAPSSTWTQHCGLVSFNPAFSFEPLWSSLDGRVLVTKVTHQSGLYEPLRIYVIYAPATRRERHSFFNDLNSLLHYDQTPSTRCIFLGDFNHNIHHPPSSPSMQPWISWVQSHLHDSIHADDSCGRLPTFRNISTIDFILLTADLEHLVTQPRLTYVNRCDHSAVSISLTLGPIRVGPGLWRCNPYLADDKRFRRELKAFCDNAASHLPAVDIPNQWDYFKSVLKSFIQSFSNKQQAQRRRSQKALQRRRNILLRQDPRSDALTSLSEVESQLDHHYEQSSNILTLRSGIRWRELGERSNAYFYRCLRTRQQQQAITSLKTSDGQTVHDPADLTSCAQQFYADLYSPDPISHDDVEALLANVPESARMPETSRESLLAPWTEDDIHRCLNQTSKQSSPGVDGIPYVILRLLFKHPFCRQRFMKVLHTALVDQQYPNTWQRSIVVLLPKKDDRSDLKNWRPISLICADAKVFTRLLATRINAYLPGLIDRHQTGFMAGRFIADNGLSARLVMDFAQRFKLPGVGLLLDQEKAYDRIHPGYLAACLDRFGFPEELISCISSLFFNTSLCINVNGFTSVPFPQGRGLRQGDPLSPLLFNLALEPLLRSIWSSPHLAGFRFHQTATPGLPVPVGAPPLLKYLAYADDIMILMSHQSELSALLDIVSQYERASN